MSKSDDGHLIQCDPGHQGVDPPARLSDGGAVPARIVTGRCRSAASNLDAWLLLPNIRCSRTRNTARSTRWCAPAATSRWSARTRRPVTSRPPSTTWSAGSRPGSATSCCSARPAPASRPPPRGSSSGCSGPPWSWRRTRRWPPSLANELREMLPHNAVEYFVSYYDYYQPEAYIAQTDTYIEKDSSINDDVERLRHSATSSLLSRRDVVVVASVSCIYGLGTPQSYLDRSVELQVGIEVPRDALLRLLVDVQYTRNDLSFTRGTFRVRGDTVEIIPSYEELAIRIEFFGDEIEALYYLHPLTGDVVRKVDSLRDLPRHPLRGRAGADGPRDLHHRAGTRRAPRRVRAAGQAAGGAAAADADQLRRRDDAPGRVLLRHRELFAAHRRPRARVAAGDAARLLPGRLPAGHRRVARHGAADRRHVRGRHVAQAQPRRIRFPAAVGMRQPSADLGGVRATGSGRRCTCRPPRVPTS